MTQQSPRIAIVKLEYIGDKLIEGVASFVKLKDIRIEKTEQSPTIYKKREFDTCVELASLLYVNKRTGDLPWSPSKLVGVTIVNQSTDIKKTCGENLLCCQKFYINKTGDFPQIIFTCRTPNYYEGKIYDVGQKISINLYQAGISLYPKEDCTIVPLYPGQIFNVEITCAELEMSVSKKDSCLSQKGVQKSKYGIWQVFECKKFAVLEESIYWSNNKRNRKIIIPSMVKTNSGVFPLVVEPKDGTLIKLNEVKTFIVRTISHSYISIEKNVGHVPFSNKGHFYDMKVQVKQNIKDVIIYRDRRKIEVKGV